MSQQGWQEKGDKGGKGEGGYGKGGGKGKTPSEYLSSYQSAAGVGPPWPGAPASEPQAPQQHQSLGLMPPDLLGSWADSLGNAVHVFSQDAYEMRLMATLTRPPRPDIHLNLRPVAAGGGWQCGNSILDPVWTTDKQLHWVTVDGRVSVWVRLMDKDEKGKDAAEGLEPAGEPEPHAEPQSTAEPEATA